MKHSFQTILVAIDSEPLALWYGLERFSGARQKDTASSETEYKRDDIFECRYASC